MRSVKVKCGSEEMLVYSVLESASWKLLPVDELLGKKEEMQRTPHQHKSPKLFSYQSGISESGSCALHGSCPWSAQLPCARVTACPWTSSFLEQFWREF